jgi:hypothetical protein
MRALDLYNSTKYPHYCLVVEEDRSQTISEAHQLTQSDTVW